MNDQEKVSPNNRRRLKSIWRAGLQIGYDSSMPSLDKSRIMLLNGIAIVTSFSVLLFCLAYRAVGYQYYYGPLYILPVAGLILVFNRYRKYSAARKTYLIGSLLVISYWCYEGQGNGNEYALIALATTSTLILHRKVVVYLSNALCVSIFIMYRIYDSFHPFIPDPAINYEVVPWVVLVNSVGVVVFELTFFRDLVQHYDEKLLAKYQELNIVLEQKKTTEEELKTSNEALKASNEKLHDFTEQLEGSVKKKTAELQSYIDAINVNMFSSIHDVNGLFIMVNEPLVEVSGYTREELIGKHYDFLASGRHSEAFFQERRAIILSGKTWRGEVENRRKDGSCFWFDCVVIPILDEEISYFLAIGLPITERKLNEEMRERTQHLLETIVFNTSHKIRGPLARIEGLVNLIKNGLIKENEFREIAEKLAICSDEVNMATSELVYFVHTHQESI